MKQKLFYLSLEEEFSAHITATQQLVRCIRSFAESVELYIHKLRQPMPSDCGEDPYGHLFTFLSEEATHTIAEIARIRESMKDSLLPITADDPFKLIIEAIGHMRDPAFVDFMAESDNRRDEERVQSLIESVRQSVSLLRKKILPRTDAEVEAIFTVLKQRYRQDNEAELADYREDFVSRSESLRLLMEAYKDTPVIKVWISNGRDINRTLAAMQQAGNTEHDLILLIGYVVRYEIVCEIAAAPVIGSRPHDYTDEQVRKNIIEFMKLNTNGIKRWWFAVYRVLKDEHKFLDMPGFKVYLNGIFPDGLPLPIDYNDISKNLDVDVFARRFDDWDEKGSVITGKKYHETCHQVETFRNMFL